MDVRLVIAALDKEYQSAVQAHDTETMDRILAEDFVLVTGNGRVWGDTAVVTAVLWAKGPEKGEPFDHKLWFSEPYVKTPSGWRYVFGQSSLRA